MIATTTVDIYRDADADAPESEQIRNPYGDEIETDATPTNGTETPVYIDVPASIIEKSQRVRDDSGGLRPVRYVVGRVHSGVDVRERDRLHDHRDGAWYSVEGVAQPQSPMMTLDVRLELELTDRPATPWTPVPTGFGYGFFGGSA